ncbi:MAG: hypothetical protein RJA25_2050 [Bacteroidota bacterium]|jgi:hypothetical protein
MDIREFELPPEGSFNKPISENIHKEKFQKEDKVIRKSSISKKKKDTSPRKKSS